MLPFANCSSSRFDRCSASRVRATRETIGWTLRSRTLSPESSVRANASALRSVGEVIDDLPSQAEVDRDALANAAKSMRRAERALEASRKLRGETTE